MLNVISNIKYMSKFQASFQFEECGFAKHAHIKRSKNNSSA